jgi:hypothetical protein
MPKFGEQLCRCGIPGLMLKQHQSVFAALQHNPGFLQRDRVIEFRAKASPIRGQDFLDQKKVFLPASYHQDA